ncbi:hypothetical protein LEMLEM_LOCUS15256 [Lemmus lemmus]
MWGTLLSVIQAPVRVRSHTPASGMKSHSHQWDEVKSPPTPGIKDRSHLATENYDS